MVCIQPCVLIFQAANPYVIKLSVLDDEIALNVSAEDQCVHCVCVRACVCACACACACACVRVCCWFVAGCLEPQWCVLLALFRPSLPVFLHGFGIESGQEAWVRGLCLAWCW